MRLSPACRSAGCCLISGHGIPWGCMYAGVPHVCPKFSGNTSCSFLRIPPPSALMAVRAPLGGYRLGDLVCSVLRVPTLSAHVRGIPISPGRAACVLALTATGMHPMGSTPVPRQLSMRRRFSSPASSQSRCFPGLLRTGATTICLGRRGASSARPPTLWSRLSAMGSPAGRMPSSREKTLPAHAGLIRRSRPGNCHRPWCRCSSGPGGPANGCPLPLAMAGLWFGGREADLMRAAYARPQDAQYMAEAVAELGALPGGAGLNLFHKPGAQFAGAGPRAYRPGVFLGGGGVGRGQPLHLALGLGTAGPTPFGQGGPQLEIPQQCVAPLPRGARMYLMPAAPYDPVPRRWCSSRPAARSTPVLSRHC